MRHGPHQSLDDEQRLVAGASTTKTDEAPPPDVLHLALILIAELSACLNLITADLARSTDLETASQHWIQRLRSLLNALESPAVPRTPASQSSARYGTDRHQGSDEHTPQSPLIILTPVASSPLPRSIPAARLTSREREILRLSQKGAPPRKIARRLQLSVHTVYTHLRNARRKQRQLQSL